VQLLASTVFITLVNSGFVGLLGLSGLGGDTDARTASVASDAGRAAAEALAKKRRTLTRSVVISSEPFMLKAAPDLSSDGGCRPGSSITRLGAEERRLVCEEPREELRDEPQEELREELREVLCESLRKALCEALREELQETPGDASCDSLRARERDLEPLASSSSSDDVSCSKGAG